MQLVTRSSEAFRPSDAYRREAKRLYSLAESAPFGQIRNEFIDLARQYEALARHADRQQRRTTTELRDPPLIAAAGLVPER